MMTTKKMVEIMMVKEMGLKVMEMMMTKMISLKMMTKRMTLKMMTKRMTLKIKVTLNQEGMMIKKKKISLHLQLVEMMNKNKII